MRMDDILDDTYGEDMLDSIKTVVTSIMDLLDTERYDNTSERNKVIDELIEFLESKKTIRKD